MTTTQLQRIVLEGGPADGYSRRLSVPPETFLVPNGEGSYAYKVQLDTEGSASYVRDEHERIRYVYEGETAEVFVHPSQTAHLDQLSTFVLDTTVEPKERLAALLHLAGHQPSAAVAVFTKITK